MSILRDVQKLLTVTEGLYPRVSQSALWRVAAKRALREAVRLETEWKEGDTIGAREGSLGDEECQDQGNPTASTTDLNDMLTRILAKPPLVISPNSTESQAQKIVQLTRSTRLPRT